MDFVAAMREVKEGKRIRRQAWDDKEAKIALYNGVISIWKSDEKIYRPWQIGEADVYSHDWEVIFDA